MRFKATIVSVAATVVVLGLVLLVRPYLHSSRVQPPAASTDPPVSSSEPVAPPDPVPPAVPPPTPPRAAAAAEPSPVDEAALMTKLRAIQNSDPATALVLARDGNARFPNSTDAAERAEILVKSLAKLGRVSEARGEAELMVNRYPGTTWALEVEKHTGAHPHRSQ
jgi:hypothetical protein